jgi:hypothetical protein
LTTLATPIKVVKNYECVLCAMTKIRNKRGINSKRKKGILKLVHVDTYGQMPELREGYIYFLTIVDNFSRKTWIYPIRVKSDVIPILNQ